MSAVRDCCMRGNECAAGMWPTMMTATKRIYCHCSCSMYLLTTHCSHSMCSTSNCRCCRRCSLCGAWQRTCCPSSPNTCRKQRAFPFQLQPGHQGRVPMRHVSAGPFCCRSWSRRIPKSGFPIRTPISWASNRCFAMIDRARCPTS